MSKSKVSASAPPCTSLEIPLVTVVVFNIRFNLLLVCSRNWWQSRFTIYNFLWFEIPRHVIRIQQGVSDIFTGCL